MKKYYMVPSRNEAYEVTPNSGFVVVMYDGPIIDFAIRRDGQPGNTLNSWDLECYCNPMIPIIPISKEQYYEKYEHVIKTLEKRTA